jgi:DNA-binding SARP family transcriptional activator/tetratricopeptide (TPR) repeat protein
MWLGVLGPLCVKDAGRVISIPAAKQRVLLAALLLHANRVMSFDDLAETLWDGEPTPGAHVTVRNYVRRLRQALGPAVGGRILTREPGYIIEVGDDELDLLRFSRLCREGGSAARAERWQRAADVLEEALALWRGNPLSDVPSQVLQRDEVPPLTQAHLQATEWRFEAALHLGRHAEIVTELQTASAKHPLREPFHAQLMLALYRCGRQADALAVYRAVRATLTDELGVEPGPELRQLHDRILRGSPSLDEPAPRLARSSEPASDRRAIRDPGAVVPRQLPGGTAHFAGRAAELAELTKLVDETELAAARVIAVIGGTPGIGKTALAVRWAHSAAERFPDGQLYVNLRGFDPAVAPLQTADAIRGFLDALAVPRQQIPVGADEQASLYRSLLAAKRMLIVLDNARDEQQVRPLLPGGSSCQVVVTTRNDLTGLVASHGARCLMLDVLSDTECFDLLTCHLGAERLAAEPDVAAQIIAHCARLPLALAITAARAATGPRWSLADLAGELRDSRSRLDALDLSDTAMSVRNVFGWSYRALSPDAARMFRMIGVNPGPDVSVTAAASLAHVSARRARALLRELTRACLLTEHVPGRFACHDLLRAYAAELSRSQESLADRQAAVHRLLDHYLHTAVDAVLWINTKRRLTVPGPALPGAICEVFTGEAEALAWLKAEHDDLLAAIGAAEEYGLDAYAWRLPSTLSSYFLYQGHWAPWLAVQRVGVAAAQRAGDRQAEATAWRLLSQAASSLGDHDEARQHLQRALAICREVGDHDGEAGAHHDMARICVLQRQFREAVEHARQSLELARLGSRASGVATALNAYGWCLAQVGDHDLALACCEEALGLHGELGNVADAAATLDSIGYIHHLTGDYGRAISYFRQALDDLIRVGDRLLQANTLNRLGDSYLAAGNRAAAQETWREALTLMETIQHPGIAAVRAKLDRADLDRAGSA